MEYAEYADLLEAAPALPTDEYSPDYDPEFVDTMPSLSDTLSNAQEHERDRIETAIAQIDDQLDERKQIQEQSIADLERTLRKEHERLTRLRSRIRTACRISDATSRSSNTGSTRRVALTGVTDSGSKRSDVNFNASWTN